MCEDSLPRIQELSRRTATYLKTKMADCVREARIAGAVAITHHNNIEVVVVDAAYYRQITTPFIAGSNDPGLEASLAELAAEFDRRLAILQSPDARDRVDAIMDACGKTKCRPKAGDYMLGGSCRAQVTASHDNGKSEPQQEGISEEASIA